MKARLFALVSLLVVASMLLVACGPAATPTPLVQTVKETVIVAGTSVVKEVVITATPAPTVAPTAAPKPTTPPTPTLAPTVVYKGEGCAAGATPVTWYVGLGAGTDPPVIPQEQAWVKKFNAAQKDACVTLQVVHNPESYDTLKAMLAAGTAPDIVGPVGKMGRANFQGAWADVSPLAKAAGIDLSSYDPALLDFTKDEGVLVGIPFALFPSFIYYNKALFDEARLPYPPHKVGEKYQGKDWNLQTFQELAQKLTVDKYGNDATSKDFDPKNVKQFGFFEQYTDARGVATFFGGGLPFDPKDPTTAVIPDVWKASWKWYYDGVWKNNFMPNSDYQNSDLLAKGNCFSSGNVAMAWVHTWYTCCFDVAKTKWDIAVVPTINGKITAKLHGDTFAITKQSKNQDAAFKVMSAMVKDKDLYNIYGGMPAIVADRPGFFANLDTKAAPNKVDWSVAEAMVNYPDLPNHEAWLPNMTKANDLFAKFRTLMDQTPGLNMDDAIAKLQSDLTAVFKETGGK